MNRLLAQFYFISAMTRARETGCALQWNRSASQTTQKRTKWKKKSQGTKTFVERKPIFLAQKYEERRERERNIEGKQRKVAYLVVCNDIASEQKKYYVLSRCTYRKKFKIVKMVEQSLHEK